TRGASGGVCGIDSVAENWAAAERLPECGLSVRFGTRTESPHSGNSPSPGVSSRYQLNLTPSSLTCRYQARLRGLSQGATRRDPRSGWTGFVAADRDFNPGEG